MVNTQTATDVIRTMRLAIGRRNENDPDSSDTVLLRYINDFITLAMSDDVRLFENFGTVSFSIDETNTAGVYDFPSGDTSNGFTTISGDALISLAVPADESVSWNRLRVYTDPGMFFDYWGFNNDDELIPGFPTEVLYYGNQFTFRTIPDTAYLVNMYGYKQLDSLADGDSEIPFDYWMRYIAYGAALDYAHDYRLSPDAIASIRSGYMRQRKLILARTESQRKVSRCLPRF